MTTRSIGTRQDGVGDVAAALVVADLQGRLQQVHLGGGSSGGLRGYLDVAAAALAVAAAAAATELVYIALGELEGDKGVKNTKSFVLSKQFYTRKSKGPVVLGRYPAHTTYF